MARRPITPTSALGMPQRGHGLLVVGRSDIAHELHDQSRVPERAGGNEGQSASERRLVAASTRHAPAALAPGAEALKAMGSNSVRTCSGSGGDDGFGDVDLDSRVSERLAARRSAALARVEQSQAHADLSGGGHW
jgi:hypothetical protein